MAIVTTQVDFELITCCSCGVPFCVPDYMKQRLVKTKDDFFCPNGHCQSYTGKTEADKVREELRRKEQELANLVQEKIILQNQLSKAVSGKCPCCGKTYKALQNHLKNRHPNFKR